MNKLLSLWNLKANFSNWIVFKIRDKQW
jgi:hypothetical protein